MRLRGTRLRGRGWRPALRIARRQVRRSLGRSILIAVLVGLPVAGATMADVLYRSTDSPERDAYRQLGDADAVVEATGWNALPQGSRGPDALADLAYGMMPEGQPQRDPATVDVTELLPAGSVLQRDRLNYSVRVGHGDIDIRSYLQVGPAGGAMSDHAIRLTGGRWPEADDEVMVTPALAERLDLVDGDGRLHAGAALTLADGPELRVAGIAVDPFSLDTEQVTAVPGSVAATFAAAELEEPWGPNGMTGGVAYLVDLPPGTDAVELALALRADGVRLVPREVLADPERYLPDDGGGSPTVQTLQTIALAAMVVGLGLLEVVLLAGAAFAVGARRQVRDLGLMAAGGASAPQIRRTVLAQGLVLGVLGAVVGVAVGAALAVTARPLWERYLGELIDHWRFGWLEIAVAVAVGVLSGLAAAIVPAVGAARMKPIDALAQRFRTSRMAARLPVVGVALFVVGAGGALVASRILAGDLEEYGEQLQAAAGSGMWVPAPSATPYIALQLAGALLATAGVVITLPGLITALARGAHRLGLSTRLALRDAARHRHRTAPAVAAIAIVVAGSTAVAFGAGGSNRADELRYMPALPDNVIRVDVDRAGRSDAEIDEAFTLAEQAVAGALPDARVNRGRDATFGFQYGEDELVMYDAIWLQPAVSCRDCTLAGSTNLAAADPALMELAIGRAPDQATLDAVAAGQVVVFDSAFIDARGLVVIELWPDDSGVSTLIELPGYVAERDLAYGMVPGAFASAEVLEAHGLRVLPTSSFVTFDGAAASADQVDAALTAGEAAGAWPNAEIPQPAGTDPAVLALTAGAAFVTLVGVAIAVSLAAAEGRADLATLAAVGAPPRRRRSLAGAQALVVGGLGVLIGSVLGVYFAYLVWPALGAPEFIWAWDTLLLTGVAVPVLAVVVAVLFTPSRLPMIRRVE